MKVSCNTIDEKIYCNIYVSTEEMKNTEFCAQIDVLKQKYQSIAIFTSGCRPFKQELIKGMKG